MELFHSAVTTLYNHTVLRTLGFLDTMLDSGSGSRVIHLDHGTEDVREFHRSSSESAPEAIEHKEEETPVEFPHAFKSVGAVIESRSETEDRTHTVAFVASAEAPLFGAPTKAFDTVITTVPYGSMVMVLEEKGRFSKVAQDGIVGWVLRDDLRSRAAHVYPEFIVGEENDHDEPNTLRVRACIKDAFHGGETEVALQSGEYVLYKLMRKNQSINWPPTRPRTPGLWHTILRGVPGVTIGVTPKTGSIMECILAHDIGHLAYVEAVFPDDRISISEANYPDHGLYSERTLTKEEWQAFNPVFIQVS